jgi:hypothetical protein
VAWKGADAPPQSAQSEIEHRGYKSSSDKSVKVWSLIKTSTPSITLV